MNKVIIGVLIVLLVGCSEGARPFDSVIDSEKMNIYSITKLKDGEYEYWITDEIGNWRFVSKKKFNINDNVKVVADNE